MEVYQYIQQIIASGLKSFGFEGLENLDIPVTFPKNNFGDFSTNAAFIFAKNSPSAELKNPNVLASRLAEVIKTQDTDKYFEEVTAENGFVNFNLTTAKRGEEVFKYTHGFVFPNLGQKQKIIFEYSSPNTNKPLHIGHVRNDVYGKACINLLKAVGYDVVSCEVINDRGIHIMKSMLMYKLYGEGSTPESEGLKSDHFVGKFYKMFNEKAGESEAREKELLEQAGELLRLWEAEDEATRALWQQMNTWFFKGVSETYKREGTTFDEVDYESEIFNQGKDLVLSGVESGVFTKEEDGSVSVDLSAQKLDKKYLLRNDGTTIYITQDMYLWYKRAEKHNPSKAFVTTSAEQNYHFAVLKELFKLLKFPWAENFVHLPYEHVYLGKEKMSSRAGNTITADELLETVEAKVRAAMETLEKNKGKTSDTNLVEQVAFGAIKFGYLRYEPNTRIYFDVDETIKLEGTTGPYIQYAYARQQSILAKAGDFKITAPTSLAEPQAKALMQELLKFPFMVESAAKELKPNLICSYLYEVASSVNTLYAAVPILSASEDQKDELLSLLVICSRVLKEGLELLGISSPQEM